MPEQPQPQPTLPSNVPHDQLAAIQMQLDQERQTRRAAERRFRRLTVALLALVLLMVLVAGGTWRYLARTEANRKAEIVRAVNQALDEAKALQSQQRWPEALAVAQRAAALLQLGGDIVELQDCVRELVRDLEMVSRLEEIRLSQAGAKGAPFEIGRVDRDYAAAFREFGIDVKTLAPSKAARAIRNRSIKQQLAVALDDWAAVRRQLGKGEAENWQYLIRIARQADSADRLRNFLRDALARNDLHTLKKLTAAGALTTLPTSTIHLLANALAQCGDVPGAVQMLGRAQQHHPAGFWINRDLAFYLMALQPPQASEAIRFYTAALVQRPKNSSLHLNLGMAFLQKGKREEAIAEFRQAFVLQPDYAEAKKTWQP